jgi:hypothetical protein
MREYYKEENDRKRAICQTHSRLGRHGEVVACFYRLFAPINIRLALPLAYHYLVCRLNVSQALFMDYQ